MSFRLTRQAEIDLIDIAEAGIRLFGALQAARYNDALFDLFDLIAGNPKIAAERSEISPPVRIHPFKAHLIVYIEDAAGDIVIIRVRHGHENWTSASD